jgi:hypothetical protein
VLTIIIVNFLLEETNLIAFCQREKANALVAYYRLGKKK